MVEQHNKTSIWHPYTKHSEADLGLPNILRADGVYLYDAFGQRYFDAVSSWWACALGHGVTEIVDAIKRQTEILQHSILGNLTHPEAEELATELSDLTGGNKRVLFASDGSSAIEAALKIALQFWSNNGKSAKKQFLSFKNAYHGDTLGSISVGFLEEFHRHYGSVLKTAKAVNPPACHKCPFNKRPESCDTECFAEMLQAIETDADAIAAVVVEPLCQGSAGMNIYPAKYLKKLADTCASNEILLIVDEIAMGFWRTGKKFAYDHAAINPDIICVGKALSGGYLPLSGTIVTNNIYEAFSDTSPDRSFYHGHTFAGNPIACAAALAALKIYATDAFKNQVRLNSEIMATRLEQLSRNPKVKFTRNLGMIAAWNMANPAGLTGLISPAQRVRVALFERGVLVRPLGDVLYLMPPLNSPASVLEETFDKLEEVLKVNGVCPKS